MSLGKSVFTIGSFTFLSRITGFLRDILIAAFLGAGPLTDVFFVAFKLPNFFRRLFGEGAFNAAFVPMFSGKLSTEGKEKARVFAENIFAIMFFFLLGFTVIMEVIMPVVMLILAPGFTKNPEQFDLAVHLTRITFPYLFFISLVAMMSGVLNSMRKFAAAASAPIFLNIILISVLLFAKEYFDTPAHALAWGVSLAGVVQFVWLYMGCRKAGLPVSLKMPKMNPEVKKLLKLMVPGIIGAGVVQINIWVDIVIGTLVPNAISYLYFADRVNQLPLGVIGVAVGVAILPLLSKNVADGDEQKFVGSVNSALGFSLFLIIPAAVGAVIMAYPIITILFERGAFDSTAALATSYGLMAYACGLPAFVLMKVFTPCFFAYQDTKTPVKIAVVALVINVVLNLVFVFTFQAMGFYPHVGIALATGIASWASVWLLARILYKQGKFVPDSAVVTKIIKTLMCSAVMALVLISLQSYAGDYLAMSEWKRGLIFMSILAAGIVSYFSSAILTKTISLEELKNLRKKK